MAKLNVKTNPYQDVINNLYNYQKALKQQEEESIVNLAQGQKSATEQHDTLQIALALNFMQQVNEQLMYYIYFLLKINTKTSKTAIQELGLLTPVESMTDFIKSILDKLLDESNPNSYTNVCENSTKTGRQYSSHAGLLYSAVFVITVAATLLTAHISPFFAIFFFAVVIITGAAGYFDSKARKIHNWEIHRSNTKNTFSNTVSDTWSKTYQLSCNTEKTETAGLEFVTEKTKKVTVNMAMTSLRKSFFDNKPVTKAVETIYNPPASPTV